MNPDNNPAKLPMLPSNVASCPNTDNLGRKEYLMRGGGRGMQGKDGSGARSEVVGKGLRLHGWRSGEGGGSVLLPNATTHGLTMSPEIT